MNPFHKFRDENPEKFLGPPILSTNVKFTPQSDFPNCDAVLESKPHSYGEMIKRHEYRKRELKKEINPDMKFSMNKYMRKSETEKGPIGKNRKTFINALQVFYNKINIADNKKVNEKKEKNKVDFKALKATTKEFIEEENNSDPSKKKEEAMNFIGDVAKNVLIKYDFFPKNNINFLKEGEGRHCSNPNERDREVYIKVLRNV